MTTEEVRAALEASREALLSAIRGLTERDFAAELGDGESVLVALLLLARAERDAVRSALGAAGAASRPLPRRVRQSRPVPPQVIHDLAGARYETLFFLDTLDSGNSAAAKDVGILRVLSEVATREQAVAARISALAGRHSDLGASSA